MNAETILKAKKGFLFLAVFLLILPGTAQNCPGSLLFDAANPAVNLPASNQYYTGNNGGYTWECWFLLNQPFGSDVRALINAVDGVLFEDMWLGFGWQGGWFNEPVTRLVFKVDGPNSTFPTQTNCSYEPPGGFQLNTWYHAAGVMNYNSQLGTLYVNGVAVDQRTITTPPITRVIPTELSYNWNATPFPLFGNMDEVRIWTRPLTALEVATNYTQCLTGNEQDLLLYYRCNQPGGLNVPDATPNMNTGTFAMAQGWSNLDAGVTGTACAIPAATLNITGTGSQICGGQSATLTAGTAVSYTWSTGAGAQSIVVAPNTTSTYTVWGSVSVCSVVSTASAVITVTVIPISPVSIVAINPQICAGSTTTLLAFGASSYTWSTGIISNSITVNPPVTTTYFVYGSPCTNTASPAMVTVTVNPLPVVTVSSAGPVCSGATVTLTAGGASTYTWSTGSTGSSLAAAPPSTLSYTVTGSTGNCTAQAVSTVSVLPNPMPVASGASVCIGEAAALTASGGVSYFWMGPNNFFSSVSNPVIPVTTNASIGIYTVTVTGSNFCTASATVQLAGNPFALPVVSIIGKTNVCLFSKVDLSGSGGVTYTWTGPGNFSSLQPYISFWANTPAVSGVYTLSVKNSSNCAGAGTVQVNVFPPPNGSIRCSHNNRCVPFCSTFSFSPSASNAASIATTAFSVANISTGNPGLTYCFEQAGDYKASVVFTDENGCSNASELLVSAYPLPQADFAVSPEHPVEGLDPVIFTNTSKGAAQEKWHWYFTDHWGGSSHMQHTSHLYESAGTFPVAMVVSNTWGCSDTIIKNITIDSDFGLYVPNAFSPNGNDLNEIFQPKGIGVITYRLEVFNRWGELLFSSNDFYKGWDGRYKGELCKMDTYIWKIAVTGPSGKSKQYTGHVSLLN